MFEFHSTVRSEVMPTLLMSELYNSREEAVKDTKKCRSTLIP